jgi:hypothetical protein
LDVGFFIWLFLSVGFLFSIGCWFFQLVLDRVGLIGLV